jgi:Flp pilus assembly pilin Flp
MLYVYCWLQSWLHTAVNEEEGQDIIEYVLIAGFIALAAVAGLTVLRTQLTLGWNALGDAVTDAVTLITG